MNLSHDFVQVSNLSEDQKEKVFTKNGTLFSPKSSRHLRSDAHQRQIIGGDADVDHNQTIGGDTIKLLGGIYPPRVSAPLPLGIIFKSLALGSKLKSLALATKPTSFRNQHYFLLG